jgi:hypothetical protein
VVVYVMHTDPILYIREDVIKWLVNIG